MRSGIVVKGGFTLLEVLVASMLLGMLVTILTMVFNQSSVAWRIGVSGVADLDDRRQGIATVNALADSAIPNLDGSGQYRIASPWRMDGDGIRQRAVESMSSAGGSQLGRAVSGGIDFNRPDSWVNLSVGGSMDSADHSSFVVGVTSLGPDGQLNTRDDITTLPKGGSK